MHRKYQIYITVVAEKYRNSPIIEALCEILFLPEPPWDSTIPERLHAKIQGDFPTKQEVQNQAVTIEMKGNGMIPVMKQSSHTHFLNQDGTSVVQVAENLLAVHQLKPYDLWEVFKPRIMNVIKAYHDVEQSNKYRQLTLRYINDIKIPAASEKTALVDYLFFLPNLPKELPRQLNAFNVQVNLPDPDNESVLVMQLVLVAAQEEPERHVVVRLDLSYATLAADKMNQANIDGWLEKAHTAIEKAFESCITDKTRELFS